MGLNMHDVVRGAIQTVNDDVPGTIYIGTGYAVVRGISTPTFNPVPAQLQIQAQAHSPLQHRNGALYAENLQTIYAYGNFDNIDRPDQSSGTLVRVTATGEWYAVTQVIEWWTNWCQLQVTRQLNAPNIAALLAQIQNGANPP